MSSQKRQSLIGGIFKIIGTIVGCILLLVVAAYCYLRFALGIDVFDIKKKIDLLNAKPNESTIITRPYDNQDAVDGFAVMFGTNDIYTEDSEGNYQFDKTKFSAANLTADIRLTDEQFASIVNLFIKNIYSEDTDFSKYISVKQIVFSSFEENAGTISTDVQVVAKADFVEFKKVIAGEKNAIVDFISGLIPDTIYITSNFKISMQMSSPDQFLVESKSVLINNLTQEQSKSILELADKLLGASDLLPENINKTFAKVLFGGEDTQGLVDVVTGCSYFTFESDGTNIYLALKKA